MGGVTVQGSLSGGVSVKGDPLPPDRDLPPPVRNMGPETESPPPWRDKTSETITMPQTSFVGGNK